MSRTLVTGGGGFIGSHLATRLVELGHEVRVLDSFCTGHRHNLSHLAGKIEVIEGDIRDSQTCIDACEGIDCVFHEAALGSVPKSVESPQDSHDTNLHGTFQMLQGAVKQKVRRFVYAGSSSAYGDIDVSPKHEGLVPEPLSPYAVQKLAGEHYCRAHYECYGLSTISLRYFNVFGSRQDPNGQYAAAIPAFAVALLRGESPVVYGDGEQSRDFTHIDNVVDGNMLAMEMPQACGESVNLACGGQITINQVIQAINDALGTDIPTKFQEPRAGDVRHSCADIGRAKALLGFMPRVSFADGLARAIDYYRTLV